MRHSCLEGSLPHCEELRCAGQSVSGSISPKIGLFQSVTFLDFSNNMLTGSLPDEIFQLPRLRKLIMVQLFVPLPSN